MDNVRCGGQEPEISECRFDSWGENDCDPSEAAGVVCESSDTRKEPARKTPAADKPAEKNATVKHRIKVIRFDRICT